MLSVCNAWRHISIKVTFNIPTGVFCKKVFFKIPQNQGKHCAGVSSLVKLRLSDCIFIKRKAFSCKFCHIFMNNYFEVYLSTAANGLSNIQSNISRPGQIVRPKPLRRILPCRKEKNTAAANFQLNG